jgi:hypothetical protein
LSGLRMPACRHHQGWIDSGRSDRFGYERIRALIERPSDATGRLRSEQCNEGNRLFRRRPWEKPIPSFVGVNKNDVDVLNSAQRAPARLGAKSKQDALAHQTVRGLAGAMQDHGSLTQEAQRRLHDTILSCGCALDG